MPKVSVIVPNYNHARYLLQRIDSVLAQTYQDFEVILLDDCSTDESRSIISEYANDPRVRIELNEKNSGNTFKQWNKGIGLAKGKYVWIAESDDYADEHLLERLVEVLDSDPQITFAYCRSWRVSEGRPNTFADDYLDSIGPQRWNADFVADGWEECRKYLMNANTVPNGSAVIFRRSAYQGVGGADENLRLCGDWKVWAAMALTGKIAYVAEPLNYYRSHKDTVRNWTKPAGIWAAEGDEVAGWIRKTLTHPDYWVPLLMSLHVSLAAKWAILRKVWALDPHFLRNAVRPMLRTIRLKFMRHWRQIRSALRNPSRVTFR